MAKLKCAECGKEPTHNYYGENLCSEHYIEKRIEMTGHSDCACPGCEKAKKAAKKSARDMISETTKTNRVDKVSKARETDRSAGPFRAKIFRIFPVRAIRAALGPAPL